MKDKIKILVKRVGQPPSIENIENDFRAMQNIVGGLIEIPYNPELPEGVDLVCNEEGKFSAEPQPNIYWGDSDIIFGDIFFVGARNGEHISITPKQIEQAIKFIEENDASDFTGDPEDLASVEFQSFDNETDFFKALFGEMFDETNNIKPAFQKKDMEM